MLTAQFHEIHGIAAHPYGELRIFFWMFHGVKQHFAVKDIDIQMMRALGEVSVHHGHQIFHPLGVRGTERFRNYAERIGYAVL